MEYGQKVFIIYGQKVFMIKFVDLWYIKNPIKNLIDFAIKNIQIRFWAEFR